jgi:hypothetical protein
MRAYPLAQAQQIGQPLLSDQIANRNSGFLRTEIDGKKDTPEFL